MLIHGENGHGPFPWDLPLWQPDYAIFFGVLYSVLLILGIDPARRPESLAVEQFQQLAEALFH